MQICIIAYLTNAIYDLQDTHQQSLESFFKRFYLFFREGKWGRRGGRKIDMREKHQLVVPHTHPNWGPGPQPRHVP